MILVNINNFYQTASLININKIKIRKNNKILKLKKNYNLL